MLDSRDLVGRPIGGTVIDRLLDAGVSTWVFAGRPAGGGPSIAVKVLHPRCADAGPLEERFRREAAIPRQLRHPNVVRILREGRDRDVLYFTMPLYAASLASRLEGGRLLDEQTAARLGRDVARGLAVAHAAGLVHRDVKPANILIAPDARAVIADFGIAQPFGNAIPEGTSLTLGTPHYISPEQAQGDSLDGRADVYALGVALYRATTGHPPLHSTDWFELARLHVETTPPAPRSHRPELSAAFEEVVMRCLAKRPDERFPSADALADALTPSATGSAGG